MKSRNVVASASGDDEEDLTQENSDDADSKADYGGGNYDEDDDDLNRGGNGSKGFERKMPRNITGQSLRKAARCPRRAPMNFYDEEGPSKDIEPADDDRPRNKGKKKGKPGIVRFRRRKDSGRSEEDVDGMER